MKIGICEDEKVYASILESCITDFFESENKKCQIQTFFNGTELIDNYDYSYDILFLDIKLPDINGIEVAKKVREKDENVIIVFLTSVPDFVYDGYEVNAFRYILKDRINNDFKELLKAITHKVEHLKESHTESVIIKKGKEQIILKVGDIIYITSYLRKLIFCTKEGNHEIYAKLSDYTFLEKKENFIKCHNAYLINIEHITSFDKAYVCLSNQHKIPISNSYKKNVNTRIANFISQRSVF